MFTGLVQQVGELVSLENQRILISASFPDDDPIQIGESIAINGCCLTVVSCSDGILAFDLSEETLRLTTTGQTKPLKANDRLGGHFVQGHVDGMGRLVSIKDSTVFTFSYPPEDSPLVCPKGSITIDGVSLTIVDPRESEFDVWVIPHTLQHTNLGSKQPGDFVNLEFDILAKHVHRMIQPGIL
jgi:riboflavin synthase